MAVRALLLGGSLFAAVAGAAYVGWALVSEGGYGSGGRALKAQYGFITMPQIERQSLRKLAMMRAAANCRWELDTAFWGRVYSLYVGEERSVRAAVYDTLLGEQERYFRADLDHRRCEAAWSRFGTAGADVPGILRAVGPDTATMHTEAVVEARPETP